MTRRTARRRARFLAYLFSFIALADGAGPTMPTFFARRDYTGLNSEQVAVADTNGDGIPDLIASEVLFGNGDGTFRPGPSINPGLGYVAGSAVGNLRTDGKVDLVFGGGLYGVTPHWESAFASATATERSRLLFSTRPEMTAV